MEIGGDEDMKIKYVINPPKLSGGVVLYKEIIVLSVQNDVVMGATLYDYNYIGRPISILDIEYYQSKSKIFNRATQISPDLLVDNLRDAWVFSDEKEAFIQKIICLKQIREIYTEDEKENRKIFNNKIPEVINEIFEDIKIKNPEYFL